MNEPDISVVMTAYNEEKYISDAITSILNQKYNDFELIIVDDNSTDKTWEIIQDYEESSKRVNAIRNNRNQGQSISRNKALQLSSGKYIAIMDADDIAIENRLNMQYEFLQNNSDVFLCGTSCIKITETGEEIGVKEVPSNPEKRLPHKNVMIHPSIMFRNNDEIAYRDKFEYSQDYDLYLRLMSKEKELRNIQTPLVKYRMTANSITQSNKEKQHYFAKNAKKFFNERERCGKDSYSSFTPKNSFPGGASDATEEQNYYEAVVVSSLRSGNEQTAKRYLQRYWNVSNNHKKKILLRLATLCPWGYRVYHSLKKISTQEIKHQLRK